MFFKKSPKPYPRSFARRLTWRIMLTFLVLMGLASYIFYKVGKESFLIASENICSEYLESHTESVRRIGFDGHEIGILRERLYVEQVLFFQNRRK